MGFNVGPRVVRATGGSIHRVGKYRIHEFPTRYVEEGLVMHLDPADRRCYGHGATGTNAVTDIAPNSKTGAGKGDFNGNYTYNANNTANNYRSDSGGCWRFDGDISLNFSGTSPLPVLETFTLEMWVKHMGTSTNGYHVWMQKDGGYSGGIGNYGLRSTDGRAFTSFVSWGTGSGESVVSQSTSAVSNNIWYHVCVRFDEYFKLRIFVDGSDASASSGQGDRRGMANVGGGNFGYGDGRYCNGEIGVCRLYDRALSDAEIVQNYKAEKVRYKKERNTDTFTPTCSGSGGKVEVLCVAGGGGGGGYAGGGGGGAGGLLYNSAYSVTNSAISVTTGCGATAGDAVNDYTNDWSAGNSVFGTMTAIGGGQGRSWGQGTSYRNGGSGGGWHELSNNQTDEANAGGNGTAGQGYKGGGSVKLGSNTEAGGGGGGAGGYGNGTGTAVGGATTTTASASGTNCAGNGGPGLLYDISGKPQWYAGGGGGGGYTSASGRGLGGSGVGGDGGFGNGTIYTQNGVPRTGSGGGGAGPLYAWGGSGAEGIVIVRYPAEDYNVEILVIGGGGGGGGSVSSAGGGGGGGAGGLIYYESYALLSGETYLVSVGDGGRGGQGSAAGENGRNSRFGDLVAFGGGVGDTGSAGSKVSTGGGSGAGAGYNGYNGADSHGTKGIPGQGYDGATVSTGGSAGGAGGGGAGSDGQPNRSGHAGGYGGRGLIYSISGTTTEYAIGGMGGGGADNARANSGDGGDGIYAQSTGGNGNSGEGYTGGSGIVIVAYKGPQRGEGGTVSTTARPGYTTHTFTTKGAHRFIA